MKGFVDRIGRWLKTSTAVFFILGRGFLHVFTIFVESEASFNRDGLCCFRLPCLHPECKF